MPKKVNQFPSLAKTLKSIIFGGKRISFNYYDHDLNIAVMFNFVKEKKGTAVIYCRIFETWIEFLTHHILQDGITHLPSHKTKFSFLFIIIFLRLSL